MPKQIAAALIVFAAATAAHAAVKEEAATYNDGDTVMKGFLVYDDAKKGKRPGIVLVHGWWGILKDTRDEARRLATQGYTAFVADMYGDGRTAGNPKEASALSGAVRKNAPMMQSRFNAARMRLARHATVDAKRIGAVGFCFGGSVVLDMARAGSDLAGVAAFHAGVGPAAGPAEAGKVKAKVLVLNGADDPFIKPDSVEAFRKEMEAAMVDYRYINYPGAVHAFTNPEATAKGRQFGLPLAYHPEADRQSKAEAAKFFRSVFK